MIVRVSESQPGGAEERLNELDRVALLVDLPKEQLCVGQVGTIVYVHQESDEYEVEFLQGDRESVVTTVERNVLLKLHGLPETGILNNEDAEQGTESPPKEQEK